jgi:hypothetical protein
VHACQRALLPSTALFGEAFERERKMLRKLPERESRVRFGREGEISKKKAFGALLRIDDSDGSVGEIVWLSKITAP